MAAINILSPDRLGMFKKVATTATPFETPMKMADLVEWTNKVLELKTSDAGA